METILRSEEMAEIMLLPVRHHSPACSFQIRKVIKSWKPSAVLIEGPYNANDLIPVMVHEDTRAPFAIYYSYHDKTGRLAGLDEEETSTEGVSAKGDSAESGEALETSAKETSAKETGREPGGNSRERRNDREFYKCYYPFLDYSPELAAFLAESGPVDLALLDVPWITLKRGREFVQKHIRPKTLLVYHLPFAGDDLYNYRNAAAKSAAQLDGMDVRLLMDPFQQEPVLNTP